MNTTNSARVPTVNITVALGADTVARLSQMALQTGHTLEDLLVGLAETAAGESNTAEPSLPLWKRSVQERVAAWRRWCSSHRTVHHFVDDSRASIYAGRGE
jgi:hypothetical protein